MFLTFPPEAAPWPLNPRSPPTSTSLPLLPLRDVVVFPHMVIPLFVGRPKSIKALDVAMDAGQAHPARRAEVRRQGRSRRRGPLPDRQRRHRAADAEAARRHREGAGRGHAARAHRRASSTKASTCPPRRRRSPATPGEAHEVEAMRRALLAQFDQYVKLNKKIPPEILTSMSGIDDGGRLADAIAAHLPLKLEQKQEILEMGDVAQAPRAPARRCSRARSTSCRSRSASAAASSGRWRRASASTT